VKRELRQRLREGLAGLSVGELHERSIAACRLLLAQPEYTRSEILMIFLSTPQEVDTSQIALQAWNDRKRVLVPRVNWDQRRMMPVEIRSLTTDVREGPLGLREPVGGLPIPLAEIELVIVPGLGFDEQGNRLGRGRGFYDRFLSRKEFGGVSCGLGFESQVVQSVPTTKLDMSVHMLVTDQRVRRFKP
jgi:5-formyltetrahydrofolate cyclo-ligase